MRRWWRGAVGCLALAFLALGQPLGEPAPAEALGQARARINWAPEIPYPSSLRDWKTFQDEHLDELPDRTLVLFRDGTFARRSNPDPDAEEPNRVSQVELNTVFTDVLTFTPTTDLQDAVLYVHQPTWGGGQECHVQVTQVINDAGAELFASSGRAFVSLGRLPAAEGPYHVTLRSQIPSRSQASGRSTPRILTSVVRVLERAPARATSRPAQGSPTATPVPGACDVEVGGSAYRSLNRPLIVRTELQGAAWAGANGRPAPTPIAIR
jgi:hypothetical protein